MRRFGLIKRVRLRALSGGLSIFMTRHAVARFGSLAVPSLVLWRVLPSDEEYMSPAVGGLSGVEAQ